jgi:hypothetical protein
MSFVAGSFFMFSMTRWSRSHDSKGWTRVLLTRCHCQAASVTTNAISQGTDLMNR